MSNTVNLVTAEGVEPWHEMPKTAVATRLIERIAQEFAQREPPAPPKR
jgi:phosphopantothenoylcysteine decarboxylase/phosphopantothenate--cysteine ligase